MEDSCDLSSLPIMPTQFFWSIGFSSFYTFITARCYCAHFVLLFLPVVLASLVALVVPATPAFLAVLKRSKPCFLERSGAIRCTQLLSGTIRYYQGCSRTLYFQCGSTVHKRRNRHNRPPFLWNRRCLLDNMSGGGRLTSSVGEIIRHAPLSKG